MCSGATKTAILAAVCTKKGTTIIHNPYPKPDVTELISFLSLVGFKIVENGRSIYITSPDELQEATHHLISDVTEIITYISCSVYMKHPMTLNNITVDRVKKALKPELDYLNKMNIKLEWDRESLFIPYADQVKSIDIDVTSIGIYSDSQPFFTLMLLRGEKNSRITEHVWHNRFGYAEELKKLGLNLEVFENSVYIKPGYPVQDNSLDAGDLRAAAVLILSALKTPGTTTINNVQHLTRGYEDFIDTLQSLGANIEVMSTKILI